MTVATGWDGVWTEHPPAPRVILGSDQVFPGHTIGKTYLEQLEDDRDTACLMTVLLLAGLGQRRAEVARLQCELAAAQQRIDAVEQSRGEQGFRALAALGPITLGRLHLDGARQHVELDGRSVELSQRSTQLLNYLMRQPGQLSSNRTLTRAFGFREGSNALRSLMSRTRMSLAEIGAQEYLQTHHSRQGYWMAEPGAQP